jgi:uncharacterized protein (DUF924 family)
MAWFISGFPSIFSIIIYSEVFHTWNIVTIQPENILDFWFGPSGTATEIVGRQRKLWFGKSPANDLAVTEQFTSTLLAATAGQLDHWASTPRGRLALVIVLDQFPHHVYRDQPLAFATDPQALALSLDALAATEDRQLTPIERVFLYLPLEHAESNALQDQSVSLYEKLAHDVPAGERALFDDFLDYARKHRDVVARFGRFPHRNAILGRPSSADELEFLTQPGSRF